MADATRSPLALPDDVAAILRREGIRFSSAWHIARGLEFDAYRLHRQGGDLVVRTSPDGRHQSNANDPEVDTAELLLWEWRAATHLADRGFPVARPHALLSGPPDVLVSGFVEDDGSTVDQVALGRLLRRLHDLSLPSPAQSVAMGQQTFPRVLVERLVRRWGVVRATVPSLPDLPAADHLLDALQGRPTDALLHLDVRRDNLRAVDGEVLALLDWSNALVGDPDLELCRLAEYARLPENGLDLDQVLTGYGRPDAVTAPWSWIYRLDAAVMLAVVFLHEAPDPPRAESQVERLLALREQGPPRQRHPRR